MKRRNMFIFILCFWMSSARAQNCDVAQAGVAIYNVSNTSPIATITVGQYANFRFSIANFGTDPNCVIPANSITAVFDFPTLEGNVKPYIYDGLPVFVSGYFTWTYNAAAEVLMGTNTTAIPKGAGDGGILVKVKGNASGSGSSNLNITQGMGVTDNAGNNFSGAQLIVSAAGPLPINLSSFTVTADKCDALLKWISESESRFSHFEVEYSSDGRTFIKVGNVQGKNIPTGANYGFTYTQLNGNGYYRLKMIDADGKIEYSAIIRATTTCREKGRAWVYPNPINYDQKLIVNVRGYPGKITGEVINSIGQKVMSYNLVNSANELSVMNLSAGVYMFYIRTTDSEQAESFRIIITR